MIAGAALLFVLVASPEATRVESISARFAGFDQDGDGTAEIERLELFAENGPDGSAPLVLAMVEGRLLQDGDALRAALVRWQRDLATEGFRTALVRADLYRGDSHQDGRTLLALRKFFRSLRAADSGFAGAVLVGAFPEAYLVRTVNWRKRTRLTLNRKTDRQRVFAKPVHYLRTVPEGVAHTCDLVLCDLDGSWERLYTRRRERLPSVIGVFEGGVPPRGGITADFQRSGHLFEDFFHVNDGNLELRELVDHEGNVTGLHIIPLDEVRDAECSEADRKRPNVIARPDILVSRIHARGVASDVPMERRLLVEYFDRNHRYRTGELEPEFRPASIAHGLGSGYRILREASPDWSGPREPELDISGKPGISEVVEWLKRPAVLRTIRAHTDRLGSVFEGHKRLDCMLLLALWKEGALGDSASFYLHTGCEAISPPAAENRPYSDPAYGRNNSATALLFFAHGLALVGRAKVFYDEPRGFCEALAEGKTFGAAWARYSEIESRAKSWREAGGDIGRKRSYFWSLLGDWTLRLRRPRGER